MEGGEDEENQVIDEATGEPVGKPADFEPRG
mgnify:FL=1